jgi:hypothetical protein
MDTTNESVTPHATPEVDPISAGIAEAEQSQTATPEEINALQERKAFETHVQAHGEVIPENFKDAGSWFDSLKEAQRQYTQGQQEISDLKQQYSDAGTVNPNYKEAAPAAQQQPSLPDVTDQLRIPEAAEAPAEPQGLRGIDESTYEGWSMEFAATGKLSDTTKNDMKRLTGFSDKMISDYEEAHKAKLRESYRQAASHVGGHEKLNEIFKWAQSNLSPEDQQGVNLGLASPSYEITLRGLEAMYTSSTTADKSNEPAHNPKLTPVPASEQGILPYRTKREFTADRNNPQFNREPRFRQAVEERMSMTDWTTLPV